MVNHKHKTTKIIYVNINKNQVITIDDFKKNLIYKKISYQYTLNRIIEFHDDRYYTQFSVWNIQFERVHELKFYKNNPKYPKIDPLEVPIHVHSNPQA